MTTQRVNIGLKSGQLSWFKVFPWPSFSPIVKTYLPGNFCISVMSSLDKVLHHWPVRKKSSMVNLSIGTFRSKAFTGTKDFRCLKTTLTSRMRWYLGRDDFNSKTPLRNEIQASDYQT